MNEWLSIAGISHYQQGQNQGVHVTSYRSLTSSKLCFRTVDKSTAEVNLLSNSEGMLG